MNAECGVRNAESKRTWLETEDRPAFRVGMMDDGCLDDGKAKRATAHHPSSTIHHPDQVGSKVHRAKLRAAGLLAAPVRLTPEERRARQRVSARLSQRRLRRDPAYLHRERARERLRALVEAARRVGHRYVERHRKKDRRHADPSYRRQTNSRARMYYQVKAGSDYLIAI